MLKKLLPNQILSIIDDRLNFDKLYEIRIRADKPAMVNYGGNFYVLSENGIMATFGSGAIICTQKMVDSIVYRAGEHSVYAINNQLRQGFITVSGGLRIGISGEVVSENGIVKTIKNYNAVNIRIPHEVKGCALTAFKYIYDEKIHNCLIVSPPAAGKTTLLRDLARLFSVSGSNKSVLILDERSEIACCHNGVAQLDVGNFSDVLTNCTKEFGFSQGVRVMRPDLIITDELGDKDDIEAVRQAAFSGIGVIASAHASDVFELSEKSGFEQILKKQVFSRFIVLSNRRGPGTYEAIYDENLKPVFILGG